MEKITATRRVITYLKNMISAFTTMSNVGWGRYPYVESVKSFLPTVDELVVAFNVYGRKDGSRKALEAIDSPKLRIVSSLFDTEKYGWLSHGIGRQIGYQACRGDIVVMFDADDVLHEDAVNPMYLALRGFSDDKRMLGYYPRNQIYSKLRYWRENKHSGIYNKAALGDRLDFFRADKRGAPNTDRLTEDEKKASRQLGVSVFAYEHFWDTEAVFREKANLYGRMMDRHYEKEVKAPEYYYTTHIEGVVKRLSKIGKSMPLEKHPKIVQDKIKAVNESHFGHNLFGHG